LIEVEGNAGAVFLRTSDTAYYWQAFTNKIGRRKHLQYKVLWEGIRWGKKNGCKNFDFEGIFDDRFPNEKWKGFSFFKKGFGGKEKKYPGAFVWKRKI
jgi:lipid II:glycine glycyltransferase (peptidoglycan interpeptide bridge formation enzyme)